MCLCVSRCNAQCLCVCLCDSWSIEFASMRYEAVGGYALYYHLLLLLQAGLSNLTTFSLFFIYYNNIIQHIFNNLNFVSFKTNISILETYLKR